MTRYFEVHCNSSGFEDKSLQIKLMLFCCKEEFRLPIFYWQNAPKKNEAKFLNGQTPKA